MLRSFHGKSHSHPPERANGDSANQIQSGIDSGGLRPRQILAKTRTRRDTLRSQRATANLQGGARTGRFRVIPPLRLAELAAALARAADPGTGLPLDTSFRTCLIGVGLARALGLAETEVRDVYYAALLRHAGCTASSHEETRLVGDDLGLRSTLGTADPGKPGEVLPRVARGLARERGAAARVRAVARFFALGPPALPGLFRGRCEVAVRFAVRLGLGPHVERALSEIYERHDGKGLPDGRRGQELSAAARVLTLGEVAALQLPTGGTAAARAMVAARAGGQLDPELCDAFARSAADILAGLDAPSLWKRVLDAEPAPTVHVGEVQTVAVAELLADFADLKSTWTLGHSRGVAALAVEAGRALGLAETELHALRLAALLHDVGRIAVSNAIWDKAGPLDRDELDQVRAHTYHTERALGLAGGALAEAARLAAMAHERLDGSGYHRGLTGGSVPVAARVLAAADVAQALSQARPHRPAVPAADAAQVLRRMARAGTLDARAVQAVLAASGGASARPRLAYPAGLSQREVEVLRLVARGLTDKEVARELGISHRTVHHHNQHAFTKIGVTTRAAAALFLIENDLLS